MWYNVKLVSMFSESEGETVDDSSGIRDKKHLYWPKLQLIPVVQILLGLFPRCPAASQGERKD